MFKKKSNQEKTEKSGPKKRDSKKKPAQPRKMMTLTRWSVNVKGGATQEKCVAGEVVMRAQQRE